MEYVAVVGIVGVVVGVVAVVAIVCQHTFKASVKPEGVSIDSKPLKK